MGLHIHCNTSVLRECQKATADGEQCVAVSDTSITALRCYIIYLSDQGDSRRSHLGYVQVHVESYTMVSCPTSYRCTLP